MPDEQTIAEVKARMEEAQALWTIANQSFDLYPNRLRRLAAAAEAQRKAALFAAFCDLKWKPQPGRRLNLAPELLEPDRPGDPELWKEFDEAIAGVPIAFAGTTLEGLAHAYAQLAAAATSLADQLQVAAGEAATGRAGRKAG